MTLNVEFSALASDSLRYQERCRVDVLHSNNALGDIRLASGTHQYPLKAKAPSLQFHIIEIFAVRFPKR